MRKKMTLFNRFLIYQKERYPFVVYFFLISAFSFSAIAYSRICRGLSSFILLNDFLVCIFNTITIFFILRILDEFKDHVDDKKFRPNLPVPRGLISLNELKYIALFTVSIQLIMTFFLAPKMLILLGFTYVYLFFMTKEFFVKNWLKRNQFWYVTSHMLIIPIVDIFASGFDWFLENEKASVGLLIFFAVSFMNGLVLEIGRKIKTPEQEEPGVLSYTYQLGTKRAVLLWILLLFSTTILAILASIYVHHSKGLYIALILVFIFCSLPAILFLKNQTPKSAKLIEYSAALWTFSMYSILGGIPMFLNLFK